MVAASAAPVGRVRPDSSGGARDCSSQLHLVSECVDPFSIVRGHFRRYDDDDSLAAADVAAYPPAGTAAAPAGGAAGGDELLGRGGGAAGGGTEDAGAAGAEAFRPRDSGVKPSGAVALRTVLIPPVVACPGGCVACGRCSPPELLLSRAVADWLQEVCGAELGAAPFSPYRDETSGKVWASLELSEALQSGTAVLLLLRALLERQGESLPFPPDVVRPGDAPPLRLRNWRLLLPLLEALGVGVSEDARTLIVAGEREPIATMLAEIKSRFGEAPAADAAAGAAAAAAAGAAAAKRLEEEREGERKELLADTVSQAIGLYSIVMACLLALFVEQQCGPNDSNPEIHQCSLDDDFSSLFEKVVLGVNFACLLVFLAANVVFWLREKFIIEHFHEDPDQPEDALPEEIAAYPSYLARLRTHNKRTYVAAEFMFVALLINFIISAVLILGKHYAGRTSVVGLLSNLFLCLSTTYGYRSTAKDCMSSDAATSLFESEPKNPNAIAEDKKFLPGIYDPEGAPESAKAPVIAVAAAQPSKVLTPSPAVSVRSAGTRRARQQPPPPPPREMERHARM